ncbi:unnamed protein product [Heterobilharzia americana]|nr:unnamed protein product [Heterobilharzia americana]
MVYKSLESVWQHCPVTALSYITRSVLAVGSANILSIFDIYEKSMLCKYLLKRFAVIHRVEAIPDLISNNFILCLCGNRFITVLRFNLSSSSLLLTFEDYQCDNVIHSTVYSNEVSFYLQTLTSHGTLKLIKSSPYNAENFTNIVSASVQLETSVCYTGQIVHFKSSLSSSISRTLVFCGSTFGKIHIYDILNEDSLKCSLAPSLTLCVQKGVIFSIDFCHLAVDESSSTGSFRLVSCAEDRSIAVWSVPAESIVNANNVHHSQSNNWQLMYHLKAGSIHEGSVIFESRIWCVRVGDWGILATGEDCRIVYYQWEKIAQPFVMRNIHRGQNVWCCSVWSENIGDSKSVFLATGGNDGGVYVRELTNYPPQSNESECVILPCHEGKLDNNTQMMMNSLKGEMILVKSISKDFAHVLFFGSNSRLFFITDIGLIYTYLHNNDPVVRQVHPRVNESFKAAINLLKLSDCSAKFNYSDAIQSDLFFKGYVTCSTSSNRCFVVVGNISGYLILIKILKDPPFMEWLDILTVNDKVMKIVWISPLHIVIGFSNGDSLILPLLEAEDNTLKFSRIRITLQMSDTSKGMKWLNTASELISVGTASTCIDDNNSGILVIGTRDGSICSYMIDLYFQSNKVYTPVWLSKSCHKRGGCTSMLVIKGQSNINLLSCGRTYGEVKYWSSDHMTWIEKLYRSDEDKIYALGFQSKYFKAISLHHNYLKDNNDQLDWSLICPLRSNGCFIIDCSGGNHYWDWFLPDSRTLTPININKVINTYEDFFYNPIDVDNDKRNLSMTNFTPLFASINRGKVLLHTDTYNCISVYALDNQYFKPTYLSPSLHGQTINACLLLNKFDVLGDEGNFQENSNNKENKLYCLAGGEDTMLSSWMITLPVVENEDKYTKEPIFHHPLHHRGHISSIRCITMPLIYADDNNSTYPVISRRYIISAGGRGQICLWRLLSSLNEATGTTNRIGAFSVGFFGSKKIRHNECYVVDNNSDDDDDDDDDADKDNNCNDKTNSQCTKVIVSSDLRVMSMACIQTVQQEYQMNDDLLVIAGCSDGYVRLIHIQVPSGGDTRYPKFSEIGQIKPTSITNRLDSCISCCLDLTLLYITSSHICFAVTTSRGELHGWIVRWNPLVSYNVAAEKCNFEVYTCNHENCIDNIFGLHLECAHHWLLNCAPIPPFHVENQLAFNCITLLSTKDNLSLIDGTSTIVVVGADDGSVRVAVVPVTTINQSSSNPYWSVSCVKHFSSVIKLATCPHSQSYSQFIYHFLSVASDQRLILWRLDTIPETTSYHFQLCPMQCILLCGLGEPHCLSVLCTNPRSHHITKKEDDEDAHAHALVVGTGAYIIRVF